MDHKPKCKTTKLPREYMGKNLYEYRFDSELLNTEAWNMSKIGELDFTKIKNRWFCKS